MNELSKEQRDQSIVVACATLLVVCALWTLWVAPEAAAKAANASRERELRERITKVQPLLADAAKVETELAASMERLRASESGMLPRGNEYAVMFNLLKEAASACKVEFLGDLYQPVIGDTALLPNFPYKSAGFQARFYAEPDEFVDFLAVLERKHPYCQFNLESMRFQEAPRPDRPNLQRFAVGIVALVSSP